MKGIAGMVIVIIGNLCSIHAQITIDLTTQDASCSGKGSISVSASGGKAPYSYEIIDNTCGLNNKPLQSNAVFTGLTSCTFTVKVIDADGKFNTKPAIVGGNYIGPSASIAVNGCSFTINVRNGNTPIQYSISLDGGRSYGAPTAQNIYTNLSEGTYFIKIEDACNSSYITSATIDLDDLEYIFFRIYGVGGQILDSIAATNVRGGQGPYQFLIVNGVDTLKSLNDHFALKDIVKTCNTQVVVKTGCGVYSKRFEYGDSEIKCLNYSSGTVEFKMNVGTPPFTSIYYFANTSTQTPGLQLNNLIKNDVYYSFNVKDACGDFSSSNNLMYQYRPEITLTSKKDCSEFATTTLTISQNNVRNTTFDVSCTSCTPSDKFAGIDSKVTLPNLNTGKKTIVISDSCGTRWTCTSEYIIPVTETCDSIKLQLVNAFLCDNRTTGTSYSGDTMPADMFYLRRSDGVFIDSNRNGVFKNLSNSQYIVQGRSASCGLIQGTYTRNIIVQAPKYRIGVNQFNTDCSIVYNLNVDYDYYPYELTTVFGKSYGTGNNATPQFGTYYDNLLPGLYILKSLKNCWEDTINLPEVKSKIKLEDITVCPAGGSVTLSGGKSFAQWKSEYAKQNLDLYFLNNLADWYDFSRTSVFNYDTANHTYFNIEPGKTYTLYMHSFAAAGFNNTCAVDSLTFTMPNYTPPSLVSDLTLKCDISNTLLAQLKINKGTKPFVIQEINCSNQSLIGSSTSTSDSIIALSNLSLATHCFKVTDACNNTAIAEAGIGNLNANIQSLKNCDNTTTFYFSTIPGATYRWTNKLNNPIGQSPSITIPDPSNGDEVKLLIDYKGCGINKSLLINSISVQKLQVNIHPTKIIKLCNKGSIKFSPTIQGGLAPFMYSWNTGSSDSTITVNTTGKYVLGITTNNGCILYDTVEVIIGNDLIANTTINNVACFGESTGSITTSLTGGFPLYRYIWSDSTTQDKLLNKPAGNYTLTVVDDASCTVLKSISITQSPELNGIITTSPASCDISKDGKAELAPQGGLGPYIYSWSDGSTSSLLNNVNPGAYTIFITDAALCKKTLSTQITKKPVITLSKIDTICSGVSLTVGNSKYTTSGNYIDTLKNRLGCDSIIRTNLVVNALLQYTINSKNPACNDQRNGEISITGINSKGPFQFLINNIPYAGLSTNTLPNGNHVVKLIDGYQCVLEKGVALANPPKITLEISKDTMIQFGDSLLLKILSNVSKSDIKNITWTGTDGFNCTTCLVQAVLKPKSDISYKVELETIHGCKVQDLFNVKVNSQFKIFAPNTMKLNGNSTDDRNQRFTLYGSNYIDQIDYLRVFNRFGSLVFEAKNFPPNDIQYGWDGTFKGQKIDPGLYIYVASVLLIDNSRKIVKGDITIVD